MSSAKEINDRGKVGHIPRLGPSLGGGRRQENKNNPYINLNKCSMKEQLDVPRRTMGWVSLDLSGVA